MASASAKMLPKTFFRGFLGLSVGPCPEFLTTNAHTSERTLSIRSYYRNLNGEQRGENAKTRKQRERADQKHGIGNMGKVENAKNNKT
jgi:hypothetical protein